MNTNGWLDAPLLVLALVRVPSPSAFYYSLAALPGPGPVPRNRNDQPAKNQKLERAGAARSLVVLQLVYDFSVS